MSGGRDVARAAGSGLNCDEGLLRKTSAQNMHNGLSNVKAFEMSKGLYGVQLLGNNVFFSHFSRHRGGYMEKAWLASVL